jgi:hypothetical protein
MMTPKPLPMKVASIPMQVKQSVNPSEHDSASKKRKRSTSITESVATATVPAVSVVKPLTKPLSAEKIAAKKQLEEKMEKLVLLPDEVYRDMILPENWMDLIHFLIYNRGKPGQERQKQLDFFSRVIREDMSLFVKILNVPDKDLRQSLDDIRSYEDVTTGERIVHMLAKYAKGEEVYDYEISCKFVIDTFGMYGSRVTDSLATAWQYLATNHDSDFVGSTIRLVHNAKMFGSINVEKEYLYHRGIASLNWEYLKAISQVCENEATNLLMKTDKFGLMPIHHIFHNSCIPKGDVSETEEERNKRVERLRCRVFECTKRVMDQNGRSGKFGWEVSPKILQLIRNCVRPGTPGFRYRPGHIDYLWQNFPKYVGYMILFLGYSVTKQHEDGSTSIRMIVCNPL